MSITSRLVFLIDARLDLGEDTTGTGDASESKNQSIMTLDKFATEIGARQEVMRKLYQGGTTSTMKNIIIKCYTKSKTGRKRELMVI